MLVDTFAAQLGVNAPKQEDFSDLCKAITEAYLSSKEEALVVKIKDLMQKHFQEVAPYLTKDLTLNNEIRISSLLFGSLSPVVDRMIRGPFGEGNSPHLTFTLTGISDLALRTLTSLLETGQQMSIKDLNVNELIDSIEALDYLSLKQPLVQLMEQVIARDFSQGTDALKLRGLVTITRVYEMPTLHKRGASTLLKFLCRTKNFLRPFEPLITQENAGQLLAILDRVTSDGNDELTHEKFLNCIQEFYTCPKFSDRRASAMWSSLCIEVVIGKLNDEKLLAGLERSHFDSYPWIKEEDVTRYCLQQLAEWITQKLQQSPLSDLVYKKGFLSSKKNSDLQAKIEKVLPYLKNIKSIPEKYLEGLSQEKRKWLEGRLCPTQK